MRGKRRNGALNVPKTPIGEHLRKIALAYSGERAEGITQAASILEAEIKRAGVEPSVLFFPKPSAAVPVAGDDVVGRLERSVARVEELVADLVAIVQDKPRPPRDLPPILQDPPAAGVAEPPDAVALSVRAAVARNDEWLAEKTAPNREKGERVVLTAIVQAGSNAATRRWIAVLTGYKSRTITTYTSKLRGEGYLLGDELVASAEGRAWLGDYKALPLGPALREHWLRKLPAGERELLVEFIRVPNGSITHSELVDRTRYASRTVTTYLSRLNRRQLIVRARRGYAPAPELFT